MYFSSARTESYVETLLSFLSPSSSSSSASASPSPSQSLSEKIDIFLAPDHLTLAKTISQIRRHQESLSFLSEEEEEGKGEEKQEEGRGEKRGDKNKIELKIAAQNCAAQDQGPLTGEVSPRVLREIGCAMVELGHAERRRLFGETDASVRDKVLAVVRNGMVPLVCVGEEEISLPVSSVPPGDDEEKEKERKEKRITAAAEEVIHQIDSALGIGIGTETEGKEKENDKIIPDEAEIILAYEPVWAIGASQPAPVEHVLGVIGRIRSGSEEVRRRGDKVRIVYGGSAGPGLFGKLASEADGLFLGRFAHEPEVFYRVLCEVADSY